MLAFLTLPCQLNSEHPEENLQVQGDGTASKKKPGSLNNPSLPIQVGLMQDINLYTIKPPAVGGYLLQQMGYPD